MSDPLAVLTPAERRVIEEILRTGGATKEIAGLVGISSRTVEIHRQRACKKLGIRARSEHFELGVIASELGYYQSRRRSGATATAGLISPQAAPAGAEGAAP